MLVASVARFGGPAVTLQVIVGATGRADFVKIALLESVELLEIQVAVCHRASANARPRARPPAMLSNEAPTPRLIDHYLFAN